MTHFNADTQLVLSASVQLPVPGISTWSVSDSSLNIAAASSSPVTHVLPQGLSSITLIMNPSTLIPGGTLTFTLSAVTSASTGDAQMPFVQPLNHTACTYKRPFARPSILMIIFFSDLEEMKCRFFVIDVTMTLMIAPSLIIHNP